MLKVQVYTCMFKVQVYTCIFVRMEGVRGKWGGGDFEFSCKCVDESESYTRVFMVYDCVLCMQFVCRTARVVALTV